MTDYLADVVMPPAEPEPEPMETTDEIIEEQMSEAVDDTTMEIEDPPSPIPEPVKKQKIPQEEMFKEKPKQTRKKRGPATPEQLERLAKGRAKAAENRALKKKLKEEEKAKDKADKELVEAVREKERRKLRAKLEEPDEPGPQIKVVETEKVVEKGYSQQDLDDAVARAVEQSVARVETLRKQRKAEKQKAQAKAKHDAKVFSEINRALKPSGWDVCFT
tara:strand:+ start:2322 stop:2978 length:657 start_codon:yes stop_codon:yes gene_type:complete